MDVDDHSTVVISCDGFSVWGGIIQDLSYHSGRCLCDVGLFHKNDVQCHQHSGV